MREYELCSQLNHRALGLSLCLGLLWYSINVVFLATQFIADQAACFQRPITAPGGTMVD